MANITPKILLSQLPTFYLIWNHTIYTADSCPPAILRAALRKTRDEAVKTILEQEEIDEFERWFVFNYSSLKLYTREEAERAISNLSA